MNAIPADPQGLGEGVTIRPSTGDDEQPDWSCAPHGELGYGPSNCQRCADGDR